MFAASDFRHYPPPLKHPIDVGVDDIGTKLPAVDIENGGTGIITGGVNGQYLHAGLGPCQKSGPKAKRNNNLQRFPVEFSSDNFSAKISGAAVVWYGEDIHLW